MSERVTRHCTSALPRNITKSLQRISHNLHSSHICEDVYHFICLFHNISNEDAFSGWITSILFRLITSLDETVLVWSGWWTFFFFGAGVFCPERLSVFTRQCRWKNYFFLCHLLRLYSWATSSPHSVVSEAAFWCKLFGFNEIIHLQVLERSPSRPQTNNFNG